MNKFKHFFVSFAMAILLIGCGGGGGGSSSGTPSSGTDDEFKQVTEYEIPVVNASSEDVLVGLSNASFMIVLNTGLEDAKAESLLSEVLKQINTGNIESIVSPGNVRNDISMDRLVFDYEDDNAIVYMMPEYTGMTFDFDHEGESTSAEILLLQVYENKFEAIPYYTGYDNLKRGGVNVIISLAVGSETISIANTNSIEPMDFDTGLLTRSYSDYAELDKSMFSEAVWTRLPEEMQDAIMKEDSFFQSFHDMHCSYVGDGLLGVTRLNARGFYATEYDKEDEDNQVMLLTQIVAYKSDITLVGANGTKFELTEVKVTAKVNISDDIYVDGTPTALFNEAQKDIDEHGLYSYHLSFKYNDLYGDVQCKRKD